MKISHLLLSLLIIAGTMTTPVLADEEPHTDLEVGLMPGTSQLMIAGDEDLLGGLESIELFPGSGFFDGMFAESEPGFEAVEIDEPGEIDAINTALAHQISLERVAFDSGFEMYEPPFSQILATNGSLYQFVQEAPDETGFHNDLIFAANGIVGDTFAATFRLVDPSGNYSASEPFTLNFVNVPEPATAALLLMGAVTVVRRRR